MDLPVVTLAAVATNSPRQLILADVSQQSGIAPEVGSGKPGYHVAFGLQNLKLPVCLGAADTHQRGPNSPAVVAAPGPIP